MSGTFPLVLKDNSFFHYSFYIANVASINAANQNHFFNILYCFQKPASKPGSIIPEFPALGSGEYAGFSLPISPFPLPSLHPLSSLTLTYPCGTPGTLYFQSEPFPLTILPSNKNLSWNPFKSIPFLPTKTSLGIPLNQSPSFQPVFICLPQPIICLIQKLSQILSQPLTFPFFLLY